MIDESAIEGNVRGFLKMGPLALCGELIVL
jgi:hypothetical protein